MILGPEGQVGSQLGRKGQPAGTATKIASSTTSISCSQFPCHHQHQAEQARGGSKMQQQQHCARAERKLWTPFSCCYYYYCFSLSFSFLKQY